ncbi:MAG: hypothetical protein LC713_00670 [Actinobacteria bacterium]|nr:hypothetical protein [Actinomycetota bacterium]
MACARPPAAEASAPPSAHEWVSFDDPEEYRTWVFDVTFLLSPWQCIFGRGCQGVLTGPAPELVQGCCSYGAHFVDAEDVARVEAAAATLTASQWQWRSRGRATGGVVKVVKKEPGGSTVTRMVDGACVFLNRPSFPGGPGCALHRAALERGRRPLELKPEVCWQLPLRREDEVADDGRVTSTLRQWDRRHWGDGGAEFHWWCTEAPDAFLGAEPVYRHMADELVAMVGEAPYAMVAGYLDRRRPARGQCAPLPHPALRVNGR